MSNDERIGEIVHYYNKISVAVVKLIRPLHLGDKIHFLGAHTDFLQEISSMQIEHTAVEEAKAGEEVALKVDRRVRRGDSVFRPED